MKNKIENDFVAGFNSIYEVLLLQHRQVLVYSDKSNEMDYKSKLNFSV